MRSTLLSLLLALSACGSDYAMSFKDASEGGDDGDWSSEVPSSGAPSAGDTDAPPAEDEDPAEPDPTDTGRAEDPPAPEGPPQCSALTAAEWRDLDHWDFWRGLMDGPDWTSFDEQTGFDTEGRVPVHLTAGDGPAIDVAVELRDAGGVTLWSARTDDDGRAELWAPADSATPLQVVALADTETAAEVQGTGLIELAVQAPTPTTSLDLMFVIDTTGSMSDELEYLKCTLESVLTNVQARANNGIDLRVSLNFYRDEGDAYVVRPSPFTANTADAIRFLRAQSAAGGGDWPEALDQALEDGIFEHDWRDAATARLLFLVADAPPHAEDQAVMDRINAATTEAARRGVRILPLAASGADQATQMLYRTLAITTGGTHTWLTDDSGIGSSHTTPVVGEHQIEDLHAMLIRLIEGAL